MVGECYNDGRCYDYLVSCYVCSCVLDEPAICQRAVLTNFRCVQRLYVDYAMFLSRKDLNLESRVHRFHLSTGFRMKTCMWF